MSVGEESRMKVEDVEVKSSIVKIEFLEEEVQRLEEATGRLQEENGRLRKYNGELRHALIKEQAQDPLLHIPGDDRGDSQLFSNKSVDDISQNLQSFDAVAFNPLIMDLVFKKLDLKTIKRCRLISKNWNESVSRILSRRNGGYGLAVRLEHAKLKGRTSSIQRNIIQNLGAVVAAAPQNWFSKALLDSKFTRRTDTQSLLLEFGHRLRSIEITGYNFGFIHLHKILEDWCPNLEQLALPPCLTRRIPDDNGWVTAFIGPENLLPGYQQLVFIRPLKLKSLFMQEQLCISVVEASPNLKTLSLHCDSDNYSFEFFKELQHCPEVTRNLENVTIVTGYEQRRINETMQSFNSIQFSKLKKLTIEASGKLRATELSEALEKFGGPLEKLVLIVDKAMDPELVFPKMNNLTELRYLTLPTMPISSIEFLTGMPNLKALYLGGHVHEVVIQQYFIDNMFSDCEQLRSNPRQKLKELYLFGVVQFFSDTFENMNTIFPNVTKLVVGISGIPSCNDYEALKKYYAGVLDGGISKMSNLKDLYLDFRRPELDGEEGFDYMSVVFIQLNKLSNLNRLAIRDNSNSTTSLVGDKLLEIPNLQQVTLIGLKLDRLAAKKLTTLLYTHGINLDIEDIEETEFEEDFRLHFEEQLTFRHRQFH